jgi:hypothetical protein
MSAATLHGLPAIDPAEAELRRSVVEAVTGRRIGNTVLVARFARHRDDRGDWLACANGVAVAFDRIDGSAARLSATDGFDTAATLERFEPILRDIEAALGIDLDPMAVVVDPPIDAVIVTVSADEQGRQLHALRLAIPPTLALLPEPPPFAPELLGHAAVAATVTIEGPRVAPHDAAELAAGDCILLGNQPLAASLSVGGPAAIPGTYDPAGQRFLCR